MNFMTNGRALFSFRQFKQQDLKAQKYLKKFQKKY